MTRRRRPRVRPHLPDDADVRLRDPDPATSDVAKVGVAAHTARAAPRSTTRPTHDRVLDRGSTTGALGFLPGQYVNLQVPGTTRRAPTRSARPRAESRLPVRNTPTG